MKTIKLAKQSYLESKVKEDLELIGIVLVTETEHYQTRFEDEYFEKVNEKILTKAKKLGASHLFGIDYKITKNGTGYTEIFCWGDAYKIKEKIK